MLILLLRAASGASAAIHVRGIITYRNPNSRIESSSSNSRIDSKSSNTRLKS